MTISSYDVTAGPYTGAGTTDTYSYDFPIAAESELLVYHTAASSSIPTLHVLNSDYTVTGVGDVGGGTIVLTAGNLPLNDKIYIVSNRDFKQSTSFTSQSNFFPALHQDAFNKLTMQVQQLYNRLLRCFRLPVSDTTEISEMSSLTPNAFLQINGTADGVTQTTLSTTGLVAEVSVQNHAAVRALSSASYTDGQVIFVTDATAPAGYFVVRTGTVTDDDDEFIVFTDDANRYAQRHSDDRFTDYQQILTKNFSSDADITLSATENRYGRVVITDTGSILTNSRDVIFNDAVKVVIVTNNSSDYSLTVRNTSGTGISIQTLHTKYIYCDGSEMYEMPPNNHDGFAGYQLLRQVETAGVDGGTFTSGAWQNRGVNSRSGEGFTVSLYGSPLDRFEIPQGTYLIKWRACGYKCGYHKTRLYNYTLSSTELLGEGSSEYSDAADGVVTWSFGAVVVTVSNTVEQFQIQHRCSVTKATNGLGVAANFSPDKEVYLQAEIYKRV